MTRHRWNLRIVRGRPRLLVLAILLLFAPASGRGEEPPEPEADPVAQTVTLTGEDVPFELRLSILASSTLRRAQVGSAGAIEVLAAKGLRVDSQDLSKLVDLYGNFDEGWRRRHREILEETTGRFEERSGLVNQLALERLGFLGEVFGRWLGALREEGRDVEAFLEGLAEDPQRLSGSIGFHGRIDTMEEIESEARLFADAFARGYGAPLPTPETVR